MNKRIALTAFAVMLGFASASAVALPNLVADASFEDGVDETWKFGPGAGVTGVDAHSGTAALFSDCMGSSCVDKNGFGAFVRQTIHTTAGAHYDLGLWSRQFLESYEYDDLPNTPVPSELSIFWDGHKIADLVTPVVPGAKDWIHFTFADLVASGSATSLEIHGRADLGLLLLDDVSVTQSVPEPASVALFGAGVAVLAVARRKRQA